ncbi:kinase-like domain-containing protein [Chaetomium tenue]|uniref:Kinase-like domain-containing protein n=1 Tax=Chaetomium tenue TaxID=1854479 RepID=A0ACB7P1D8_9PEZI|nr:kinase-like domain-containing protein [Chaetomium globosum]
MASLRWATGLCRRAPLAPRSFSNLRYDLIPSSVIIDEETLPDYRPETFYPVRLGEVFASRYQIVAKLGYGSTSTAWLARDLHEHCHVAVKVFARSSFMGSYVNHERSVYQRISEGPPSHPGRGSVRQLLDTFQLEGPDGEHQCLVHPPLFETLLTFLARNPAVGRLPKLMLAVVLHRLFLALDYLHNGCGIIHADVRLDNIMFECSDESALMRFEQAELDHPSPRKEVNGRVIHITRMVDVDTSAMGWPILCDFGSAVFADKLHDSYAQPRQYRAPEVVLKVPWGHKIDIWNVGCLIWDIFEGRNLFDGIDPKDSAYRGRAHLAEMISLLGPPPPEFINRGDLKDKFFSESGEWTADTELLPPKTLEHLETSLEGAEKQLFLQLMNKMLQWAPEDRKTAKELAKDPWIIKNGLGCV